LQNALNFLISLIFSNGNTHPHPHTTKETGAASLGVKIAWTLRGNFSPRIARRHGRSSPAGRTQETGFCAAGPIFGSGRKHHLDAARMASTIRAAFSEFAPG
jgi:hypothetical protein